MSSDQSCGGRRVQESSQYVGKDTGSVARYAGVQERGFKTAEGCESVGHRSGKKIVILLGKTHEKFTNNDIAHTRKVVGCIHRHLAQRPDGDITKTPWRFSLMNWGHDQA